MAPSDRSCGKLESAEHTPRLEGISKLPSMDLKLGPYRLTSCLSVVSSVGPYWCMVYHGYRSIPG